MEVLESAAYITLGFVPTLTLLEMGYRMRIEIRRGKGVIRGGNTSDKVTTANSFQDIKECIQ
jgi:hypothetical protein